MDKKDVKKDHKVIKKYLSRIIKTAKKNKIDITSVKQDFKDLCFLWNTHEDKEDTFIPKNIEKNSQKIEKMPLDHKELQGHDKVIRQALKSRDINKIKVALDTDGKMLFDKMINHIKYEENIFLN